MGFQTTVNLQQAPAVEGDFASTNPRASVISPESGFVAGAAGVTVGQFAWVQADGVTVLNTGTGVPNGYVHREQQALITTYLAEGGMVIPAGFMVTLQRTGDYFDKVTVAAAVVGNKAFAKLTDGTMQPGAAGATISGFVETAFVISQAAAVGELAVITQ
jgi:hypothetical protein